MRNNISRFFQEAEETNSMRFLNADGFDNNDLGFSDDDFSFTDDDGFSASGSPSRGGGSPTSQPYIVNIENTTTNDISNVTIMGAYSNIGSAAPAFNNTAGISITMGIPNVTYSQFLWQSQANPFSVGVTYATSTSDQQVLETWQIVTGDANGNSASKVIVPVIDPYQQQTNRVAVNYQFSMDGFTSIVIARIYARSGSQNGNLKVYFYPTETIKPGRILGGQSAGKNYGNPKVVRPQRLELSSSQGRQLKGRG